ncbi:MAG: hypothetical protein JXQ73_29020 [Phycisphaerae bacterium]|nr:hypothetical protein [Phycisphaerae bacterium]
MSHKVGILILVAICLVLMLTGCATTQQNVMAVSQTPESAEPQAMSGGQTVSVEAQPTQEQATTESEQTVERTSIETVSKGWQSPRLGPSGRP